MALLLSGGLIAGQELPEAALAAEKASVVSAKKTSVASRAKTSIAAAEKTPDISISSTTPGGGAEGDPHQLHDQLETKKLKMCKKTKNYVKMGWAAFQNPQ